MKKILFIIALFQTVGCTSPEKGKNILSEAEMVQWLIDIHLAEARLSTRSMPSDIAHQYFKLKETELMEKHSVGDSLLMINYQYYLSHPELLERIYGIVVDSLSLQEKRLKQNKNLKMQ